MRLRRRAIDSVPVVRAPEPAPIAAWDGLVRGTGPVVVIRATRAGELADDAQQVA